MKINNEGEKLIKSFEGLRLNAYLCSAGIPTVGYGNTFYEDGTPVKIGDKITKERADKLFHLITDQFSNSVRPLIKKNLTENQFSALVSFAYNVGINNLRKSTLLKLVNSNPLNPQIANEFMKWNKAGGKPLAGLTRRRVAESELYFK